MPTTSVKNPSRHGIGAARKVWREVSRSVLKLSHRLSPSASYASTPPRAGRSWEASALPQAVGFDPSDCTVEPEGVEFIKKLVRQSHQYAGPIIEIGTLMGITTSHMALAKTPLQRIITVDLYCWNPWGLAPSVHEKFTATFLHYLVEAGHVERISADKNEFFRSYRGPAPAMVFLDAMHDYEATKQDIAWAQNAGARIIAGHDYCEKFPGVMQIVDELGGPRELGGTVWVL